VRPVRHGDRARPAIPPIEPPQPPSAQVFSFTTLDVPLEIPPVIDFTVSGGNSRATRSCGRAAAACSIMLGSAEHRLGGMLAPLTASMQRPKAEPGKEDRISAVEAA